MPVCIKKLFIHNQIESYSTTCLLLGKGETSKSKAKKGNKSWMRLDIKKAAWGSDLMRTFIHHGPTQQLSDKTSWKYPNYDYICNYALEQHCYQQENRCWVMKNACFFATVFTCAKKNFLVWFFFARQERCKKKMPSKYANASQHSILLRFILHFMSCFYEILKWQKARSIRFHFDNKTYTQREVLYVLKQRHTKRGFRIKRSPKNELQSHW